jgi:hypothetical protein
MEVDSALVNLESDDGVDLRKGALLTHGVHRSVKQGTGPACQ